MRKWSPHTCSVLQPSLSTSSLSQNSILYLYNTFYCRHYYTLPPNIQIIALVLPGGQWYIVLCTVLSSSTRYSSRKGAKVYEFQGSSHCCPKSRRCMCSSVQLVGEEQLSEKADFTRQLEGDSSSKRFDSYAGINSCDYILQ